MNLKIGDKVKVLFNKHTKENLLKRGCPTDKEYYDEFNKTTHEITAIWQRDLKDPEDWSAVILKDNVFYWPIEVLYIPRPRKNKK
jgi:hypothetical protein